METSGQRGVHVPPGEGESLWVVDDTYTFKDVIENTGGALLLFEASSPPQGGPPPHVHHQEDGSLLRPGRGHRGADDPRPRGSRSSSER